LNAKTAAPRHRQEKETARSLRFEPSPSVLLTK